MDQPAAEAGETVTDVISEAVTDVIDAVENNPAFQIDTAANDAAAESSPVMLRLSQDESQNVVATVSPMTLPPSPPGLMDELEAMMPEEAATPSKGKRKVEGEDAAATKLQAAQRGKKARAGVASKRNTGPASPATLPPSPPPAGLMGELETMMGGGGAPSAAPAAEAEAPGPSALMSDLESMMGGGSGASAPAAPPKKGEEDAAATKMQAAQRGKKARANVAAKKTASKPSPPPANTEEDVAATKLQAAQRGKKARAGVASKKPPSPKLAEKAAAGHMLSDDELTQLKEEHAEKMDGLNEKAAAGHMLSDDELNDLKEANDQRMDSIHEKAANGHMLTPDEMSDLKSAQAVKMEGIEEKVAAGKILSDDELADLKASSSAPSKKKPVPPPAAAQKGKPGRPAGRVVDDKAKKPTAAPKRAPAPTAAKPPPAKAKKVGLPKQSQGSQSARSVAPPPAALSNFEVKMPQPPGGHQEVRMMKAENERNAIATASLMQPLLDSDTRHLGIDTEGHVAQQRAALLARAGLEHPGAAHAALYARVQNARGGYMQGSGGGGIRRHAPHPQLYDGVGGGLSSAPINSSYGGSEADAMIREMRREALRVREQEMAMLESRLAEAMSQRESVAMSRYAQEEAELLEEEAISSVVQHLSPFGLNRNLPWQIYATRPKRFAKKVGGMLADGMDMHPRIASEFDGNAMAPSAVLPPDYGFDNDLDGGDSAIGPLRTEKGMLNSIYDKKAAGPQLRARPAVGGMLPPVRGAKSGGPQVAWGSPRGNGPPGRGVSPRVMQAPGSYY